jgi:hypothetical protein
MGSWIERLKELFMSQDKSSSVSPAGSITVERTGFQRLQITVDGMVELRHVEAAQKKVLDIADPGSQTRGLVRAEKFTGFARGAGGGMDEIMRMYAVDERIERIAVVADPTQHEDLNLYLCGWTRRAELQCLAPSELEKAKAWLES